jgi:hypothetical protein
MINPSDTENSSPLNVDEPRSIPEYNTPKNPMETRESRQRLSSRLKSGLHKFWILFALMTYTAGIGSGYLFWGRTDGSEPGSGETAYAAEMQSLAAQINPEEGYQLPITYGNIGPEMLAAGVIDLEQFVQLYEEMGRPLSQEQLDILTQGSDQPVVINSQNQHFILNLFWAFGLSNQNVILTEGPMMRDGEDKVVNFASTGGWTLAKKPVRDVYASLSMVSLTAEQQERLEQVALAVYRPCCDNPTFFPDCNHGMAMLGLLERMAFHGATVEQMFEAAKYINAFWFPGQTLEIAIALKAENGLEFEQMDGEQVVGKGLSSGSGFQAVHQWLAQSGKLPQLSQGGGSCGVQ